jgi:hypothetical protein
MSWFRLIYVLVLPIAACILLSQEGMRIGIGWAFAAGLGIFLYDYVQAALIVTERRKKLGALAIAQAIAPIALVGWASGFGWKEWIVEQMLLEAGAFSLGMGIVAIRKGWQEGKSAPWLVILLVFLLPAIGICVVAGKALFRYGGEGEIFAMALLGGAFLIALIDAVRRISPYALGKDQLEEPIGSGVSLVLVVVLLFALLIGVPWLLSGR